MSNLQHLHPAELHIRLRNAKAREAMLLEALAPFAAAWPLHRARVTITHRLHEEPGQAERQALEPFHAITLCGQPHRLQVALTGADLREAFEAFSAVRGTIDQGGPGHG
tara:strand:+ start:2098 stop:2424 length:327 start_codon:yes stop_codon:yes gene_type:complete